jgi:cobaltochelatase CobT
VDHSGSMRGQPMLLAAGTVSVVSELLSDLKVTQEVLGFTTARWAGGLSRDQWRRNGRAPYPGRLNDLLHIVYTSAGSAPRPRDYAIMLRPNLLKENLDGEAIEWAATRLRARPERRKHLIVISDGAPVDDSTLAQNGAEYLERHLLAVIRDIAQAGDIQLSAIGLYHAVDRYYPNSTVVNSPDDLGNAAINLVERLLLQSEAEKVSASPCAEQGGALH